NNSSKSKESTYRGIRSQRMSTEDSRVAVRRDVVFPKSSDTTRTGIRNRARQELSTGDQGLHTRVPGGLQPAESADQRTSRTTGHQGRGCGADRRSPNAR